MNKQCGDGAYNTYEIWELLKDYKIEGIIPPQENTVYWVDEFVKLLDLGRNKILEQIDKIGRKASNYQRRSLSETAMMRFKVIFGSTLYSRIFENKKQKLQLKLNDSP